MMYLYAGCGVAFIAALILFGWVLYRSGRNSARVQTERQNTAEANSQNATLSRVAQAEANTPQTDEELFEKMREGKEGQ